MRPHLTTNRIRRHDVGLTPEPVPGDVVRVVAEPPPLQAHPPKPLGDLSTATIEEVAAAIAKTFGHLNRNSMANYRHGTRMLLTVLADYPGQTWQERWDASGLDGAGRLVADLGGDVPKARTRFLTGAGLVFAIRLIRPSLGGAAG
jgi:hypothetical protein